MISGEDNFVTLEFGRLKTSCEQIKLLEAEWSISWARGAALLAKITWQPGFNDTDLLGIITFALYGLVAFLCWRRHRVQKTQNPHTTAWAWLGAGFAILGINKQLDLQTLLIQSGRELAIAACLYQDRLYFHYLLFGTFTLSLACCLFVFYRRFQSFLASHRLLTFLLALLPLILIIRSASIDHLVPPDHEDAFDAIIHRLEAAILVLIAARIPATGDNRNPITTDKPEN